MNVKDIIVRRIRDRAVSRAGVLAGELARAKSEDKEAILAGLEFEKWLAEACEDAVDSFS